MYNFIRTIFYFIRENMYSNPFEYITNNTIYAVLLLSFFENKVFKNIAYEMCGIFYERGSNKVIGIIGFTTFFCINIQVFAILCQWIQDLSLVILVYMIFVVTVFSLLYKLKDRIYNFNVM